MAFKVLGSAVIDENENIVGGSATFAGPVNSPAFLFNTLESNGGINISSGKAWIRQDGANGVFRTYQYGSGESNITSSINGDGSSEFFKTLLKTPTGTANSTNLLSVSDSSSNVNFTVKGTGATNIFGPLVVDRNAGGDPDTGSIVVQSGGTVKTRLNDDGSATFGGVLTGNQRVVINQAGGKTGSANTLLNYAGDGTTVTASFTADGGAEFAGTVDAGALTIGGSSVDTSAQVDAKIAALVDGAPTALNTLNELAAALNDQSDYASSITSILSTKANSSSLATVATSGSYTDLSNKPSIPTHTSHLTNNSGFITSADGGNASSLSGYGWSSSGKDVRATEFYADNWFRNYNDGEGLYNQATGIHWHADGDGYWTARDSSSHIGIKLKTNGSSIRGYVYADSGNEVGFLDSDHNWAVRCVRDSYVELRDNNEVTFRAGQSGVDGDYGTVCTHGTGKNGWEGYSINGRYVFMSSDSNQCGIFNDVDNEWILYAVRNSYTSLYHNGGECFRTTGTTSATIGGSTILHSVGSGLSKSGSTVSLNIEGLSSLPA